jgi:hypothetical protein
MKVWNALLPFVRPPRILVFLTFRSWERLLTDKKSAVFVTVLFMLHMSQHVRNMVEIKQLDSGLDILRMCTFPVPGNEN